MALWFLYTAHDYGIPSETVEVAQAMVDRVSSVDKNITENFDRYQISCFVCLLVACKTLETKHFFKESSLRKVGRAYFSTSELNVAELDVLYSLKWRIHPPSSIDIANQLLASINDLGLLLDYTEIKQKVTLYLIFAFVDSRFLPFKKSSIALAAVLGVIQPQVEHTVFQGLQKDLEEMLLFTELFEDELVALQAMMMMFPPNTTIGMPGALAPWIAPSHNYILASGLGPSPSKQLLQFEPPSLQLFEILNHKSFSEEEQERMLRNP